jgi:hypothetical protein
MQKVQTKISLLTVCVCLILMACNKKKETPVTPVNPVEKDSTKTNTTLITLPTGWTNNTKLSSGMPATASVYEYNQGAIKARNLAS